MFWSLSARIAHFILPEGGEEDREVYSYGVWLMLTTLFETAEILLLGILLHGMAESILYLAVMMILRTKTGGYHASTFRGCNAGTISLYLLNLLLSRGWMQIGNRIISITFASLMVLVIMYKAPVEHRNKPLSDAEKRWHRRCSAGLSVGILMAIAVFYNKYERQMAYLTMMMGTVACLMLLELLLQKRRQNHEKEH